MTRPHCSVFLTSQMDCMGEWDFENKNDTHQVKLKVEHQLCVYVCVCFYIYIYIIVGKDSTALAAAVTF